ncbi:lipase family protein [Longimicrobium sp.]|uniref:lipase family protein n=1 Tax=Longimicrobium sp. TaxID=2029185 RepID=UPI002BF1DFA4|nr:hypothetical protein [Longimicrobium sp.]HSU16115.1 hypothetical protein [Longimicrobium sp.]
MPTPAETTSNFGYYPRTMINLAVISYDDPMSSIPGDVAALGWQVVWGPAELVDDFGVSYSRAYIAHRSTLDEYTVVIRGTNPDSWETWSLQDFDVGTTVPFNQLAPHAPSDALISTGTYNGMTDILSLADPVTGQSIAEYLAQADPTFLYVTGHSLGGTLTPTLYAYLNDVLYGGGYGHNMALFSFAGLTPGDAGFNTYFNGLGNPEFPWRYHNTLDIAPFCWWSPGDVQNIYAPWDLSWGWPEDEFMTNLFTEAAPIGYAQPVGDWTLPGNFNPSIIDDNFWTAQAIYQHHGTTYQSLVYAAFPVTAQTFVNFKGIRQPEPAAAIIPADSPAGYS